MLCVPPPSPHEVPQPPVSWTEPDEKLVTPCEEHVGTGERVLWRITGLQHGDLRNGLLVVAMDSRSESEIMKHSGRMRVYSIDRTESHILRLENLQRLSSSLDTIVLDLLPHEMLAKIACHVASTSALVCLQRSCRQIHVALQVNAGMLNDRLWRRLSIQDFPRVSGILEATGSAAISDTPIDWRAFYMGQHRADQPLPLATFPRATSSLNDFLCTVTVEFLGDQRRRRRGPRRPLAADFDGPRSSSWTQPFSEVIDSHGGLEIQGELWDVKPPWARFVDTFGHVGWRLTRLTVFATHRMRTVKLIDASNFLLEASDQPHFTGYFGADDDNNAQRLAYQFAPPELYIEGQTLFDTMGGDANILFCLESDAHTNHPQRHDEADPRVLTRQRLLHYLENCVPWPADSTQQ